MEIQLDHPLIDRIVSDELAHARREIAEVGPVEALARSQARHDVRLAAADDAPTLACKAGCFWCCYFTVEARPVEVLRIVDFLQREMPEEDRERCIEEIKVNSAVVSKLDADARLRHNLKCPFLHLGRCSIYPVRPQTCRNYHATNATGCEKAYREPENDDIDPEFAAIVYQSGGAHVDAFSAAMQEAGYDTAAYELSSALAVALDDSRAAQRRFEAREPAFPTVEGTDVPPEFLEGDP